MLHSSIRNRLGNLLPACCAALACLAALPLISLAADDERARLLQQRRTLSEAFAAEERACTQRFAVTACVDAIKLRRRESLAPLRERELQIDEAERAQKAAERRAAIAAKRAAAASAPAASAAGVPELRVRQPSVAASAMPRPSPARDDGQERAVKAEQRARQGQQRRDQAAAAQQRVQRRQAARSASGRKSDPLPLPLPAASSAPQR